MLYALCFMHTIVQERRKFGPLGFNIPYEFNQSDLSACVTFMQNHLNDMETKKRPVDWIVVNYMVCMVQYGGRITDDCDRRLFNTYGKAWLSIACLDADFEFYRATAPPTARPGTDIDRTASTSRSCRSSTTPRSSGCTATPTSPTARCRPSRCLATILDIQPKEGGGGGGLTREEVVLQMVKDLQAKLPPDYKADDVRDGHQGAGRHGQAAQHLPQAGDRPAAEGASSERCATIALQRASSSPSRAPSSCRPTLADALDALFMARVPAAWTKVSQLVAPNMGVWFVNILNRAEQFTNWLRNGRPSCFWLTGFFNPTGFLTANRQEVCRKHSKDGWALDDVIDASEVLRQEREEVRKGPDEGSYFYGLFLEGCKWDKLGNKLADSDPKILFAPLPVLHVTGVLANPAGSSGAPQYACPVYKNPKRTGLNFVFTVHLRTEEQPQKWTLRGVALLATID